MSEILLLIALLACPLGMLLMGGIAWFTAKAVRARSSHEHHGPAPAGKATQ